VDNIAAGPIEAASQPAPRSSKEGVSVLLSSAAVLHFIEEELRSVEKQSCAKKRRRARGRLESAKSDSSATNLWCEQQSVKRAKRAESATSSTTDNFLRRGSLLSPFDLVPALLACYLKPIGSRAFVSRTSRYWKNYRSCTLTSNSLAFSERS